MSTEGFTRLLRRAKGKDPQATDQFLALIRPRLKLLALAQVGFSCPQESISDLVQEAVLKIWKKIDQFQGTDDDEKCEAMFYQWAGQIIRHMARDMRRDRTAQRRKPAQGVVSLEKGCASDDRPGLELSQSANIQETPSSLVRADEQQRIIWRALESLSDETAKKILQLRFDEGLSLRQISEQLGISYDKVREHYNRSLRYLESKLEGLQ